MTIRVCVFDAYGTLFDVAAAAREAAAEPGHERLAQHWQALAETWRQKQLQYTWLRAAYGTHTDFWEVTTHALDYALEAHGLEEDDALRGRLLQLYWELSAFPEVPDMLAAIKGEGMMTAILSNGAPDMLAGAVSSAGIGGLLDAVLSAEQCGVFKPARAVYDLVGQHFGVARREVLFVSSNGWDAGCATGYGFETVWANRKGEPLDRLPWRPVHQMKDLSGLPDLVMR
jgi:2-haloacid dehalogenase